MSREIPLKVELATTRRAFAILASELGWRGATAIFARVAWDQARGEPFTRLPPAVDRREQLSRRQAGPAILMYRALCRRLDRGRALELTKKIVVAGAVIFLGHTVGSLDRDELLGFAPDERKEYVEGIGERFFNATARWDEISVERVRFTVTRCAFPALCAAAGAPEVAPLLCAGDEVYFGKVLGTVELERPDTIAGGGQSCPFTLTWKQEV